MSTIETVDRRVYDFPFLTPSSIVLEVGAYKGLWARRIAEDYGCRVVAFEPIPVYRREASRWCVNVPVEVHPFGLGGRTRYMPFAEAGDLSSTFLHNQLGRSLPVRAIDEVLASLGIEEVDLIQINCEGGEYELLEYMLAKGMLPQFYALLIQFHEYENIGSRRQRQQIREGLSKTHRCEYSDDLVFDLWIRR